MISRLIAYAIITLGLCTTTLPASAAKATAPDATASEGASQLFQTTPIKKADGTRWRIAYVESGEYADYPATLAAVIQGLQRLGWLTLDDDMPEGVSGHDLWIWLGRHTQSTYLELVPDAWWQPGNFDAEQRAPMREAIAARIEQQHDIDLIIAMGTWAGQDLRALGPPVPTIVGSTSDPLAAKISDSATDSGRDNLHTRIEPERYQRQVRLFHEIVPFKELGIVYEDSEAGRSYGAVAAVEQVGQELGFKIRHCHAQSNSMTTEQAIDNALQCYQQLADQNVDAVYVTTHRGVTSTSIRALAQILEKAKIPSFSMAGSRDVKQGILLSLAQADLSYVGLFHAETIARVLNGAKPRQLSQLWVDPPKIALNLGTARIIGFDPPVDILLAADEVYESRR
ncbi:hypothetical protein LKR43_14630 [Pusillimonas sp. MFBS29]|uniref:ABC transporter substrate-binding protein n=1 Tax=Pusillimonas sp. MFBS29 TaxID=2886690 RepID=UPI001D10B795|nr:ABC transporter substrate binding protein [Pusillimonas sp. MFBS29]MCC2597569.1 hypothetical protein [Pusillimonas sp. MFBS29]